MNSNTAMQQLIDILKADTSMMQPYKNYALSDAVRLQALIEKGAGMTNQTPPDGTHISASVQKCLCMPGQKPNVGCPVHGISL